MISEGVDIPRLRILLYMPYAKTELVFRQAMGRVVRNFQNWTIHRAYVVLPTHDDFEKFAQRVEAEMSPSIKDLPKPTIRFVRYVKRENATECFYMFHCEHVFSNKTPPQKTCGVCEGLNPIVPRNVCTAEIVLKLLFSVSLREACVLV